MIIRLVHPEHGATHVYNNTDLESHVRVGWSVDAPEPREEEVKPEVKRGRPPKK